MNNVCATKPLPIRFGFLLINDFTLISMSSTIEPLRMANRICDEDIYAWRTISESGNSVTASNGLSINVDTGIDDENALSGLDAIFVCSGIHVEKNISPEIVRWLRSAANTGIAYGSTCTGSHILAQAGLLGGYRCSVHWENMSALTDLFPNTHVNRQLYTIDRDRYTCSGGTAPVDMMLHFIQVQCGAEVSAGVAEQFIYDRIRPASDRQRIPLRHVVGNQSEKLIIAIELMEANIRETISQAEIAKYTDLSRRQLQRLFQRFLMCTPSQYYLQIRLNKAKELLQQTNTRLDDIVNLAGFVSTSHFSKRFKEQFGYSPSAERKK
jgi:transcriptional regulator GlxA family with amidase domain